MRDDPSHSRVGLAYAGNDAFVDLARRLIWKVRRNHHHLRLSELSATGLRDASNREQTFAGFADWLGGGRPIAGFSGSRKSSLR
jgi:hypothetical protein